MERRFSLSQIEGIIGDENQKIAHDVDINVTKYIVGEKVHFRSNNGEERCEVNEKQAMKKFKDEGWSIRFLCPHFFSNPLFKLLSSMEELFQSMVGCNSYLTPAGSQGYAPHFDDIEAFIFQVEGRKRWKVYEVDGEENRSPRYPSRDFSREELPPILIDTILGPGDLLYLPRGYIHEAISLDESHSLHLTFSMAQLKTPADLFETILPQALSKFLIFLLSCIYAFTPFFIHLLYLLG